MIQSLDTVSSDLVYVDFPEFSRLNKAEFHANSKNMKITKLHSEHPECDIDGTKFIGRYEVNLGSQLFFEHKAASKDDGEPAAETNGGEDGRVQYHGMTIKVLNFYLTGIDKESEKMRVVNKLESMQDTPTVPAVKRSYSTFSMVEEKGGGGGEEDEESVAASEVDSIVEVKPAEHEEEAEEEEEEDPPSRRSKARKKRH